MAKLLLENALDSLSLNGVEDEGAGVQATTGVTGLGLPPVSVQWLEGAGDGATYRRSRTLPRDIDIPLDIVGRDREDLKQITSRLAKMLAGPCTLRMIEDDGTDWSTEVVRIGGGEYSYGNDTTGNKDVQTVITLRAGDPYWTSSKSTTQQIGGSTAAAPFISGLMSMPVASSQAMGSIILENTGDVTAYPVWTIFGPGDNFKAISPTGETLWWKGTLTASQKLIVDTQKGTVKREDGSNQYALLAAAPRFWAIEPGTATCTAELLNTTSASKITVSWRPRKWMVI
ncbi:minor tail protein [Streptomyces phage Alsaber]|uniref:Minor tail protein n=1 Tax=Streptomyces phage Alsaber TaxID=2053672 RepID=A0A2H4PGF7_9CAUD|nr:minor tail protein [Streptomyces phage Alsaber]ATW61295.1 minor tail protein [Streptomyces phage Alsaber]